MGSVLIVLPKVRNEDSNCFRIWNYSHHSVILQYRYGDGIDEIYNLFTMNSKAMVWVEYSSLNKNFAIVGSQTLNEALILN